MNRLLIIFLSFLLIATNAPSQDVDKAVTTLAEKLAALVKENGKKKVTVLDFSDLNGQPVGELGKYIAEQMTIEFVMMGKRDFSVLDRANLRKILTEHKLTATGLVDPENAKKLGQFAGVDALILGTILPKGDATTLNAKIITTDTAEIVGATRAEFKPDAMVQKLISQPAAPSAGSGAILDDDKAKVTKAFGDLRVELRSLTIASGKDYLLSMQLVNTNPKRPIFVALNSGSGSAKGVITDADGYEFRPDFGYSSGIKFSQIYQDDFRDPTEIAANESVSVTVRFESREKRAAPGSCRLQLEIISGGELRNYSRGAKVNNLITKFEAN